MIETFKSFAAMMSIFTLSFAALILTGCSSYQNHFDCPPGQGVGCKSVSQVDQLVEEGKLGQSDENEEGEKLVRKPLHVWLAPYQDRSGNLHSPSLVILNPEEK